MHIHQELSVCAVIYPSVALLFCSANEEDLGGADIKERLTSVVLPFCYVPLLLFHLLSLSASPSLCVLFSVVSWFCVVCCRFQFVVCLCCSSSFYVILCRSPHALFTSSTCASSCLYCSVVQRGSLSFCRAREEGPGDANIKERPACVVLYRSVVLSC